MGNTNPEQQPFKGERAFFKGKCPHRPQPRGGRTLVGKPQASGLVWTHVLASHPSWVSWQWQELPAVPGAGGRAEGKGGAVEKAVLCLSAPRGHPCACKRDTRCHSPSRSPRAARAPAPCCRAHDGAGGPAAPKPCAQAARAQAAVTRESRNITARSFFSSFR